MKSEFRNKMEEQYKDDFYNSLYVFQTRFDIPKNYCLEKPIGTGGFGVVLRASSLETGETLAIKKIIKVRNIILASFFKNSLFNS